MLKKIILGLIILISSFYLISCANLEDIIPNETEYGNWDGNYFYFENYKCKTTGEDEQILIPEFTYEEKTYTYDEVMSYKIINNNIYMNMRTTRIDFNDKQVYEYFIIKYMIEEQNYQIIKKFDNFEGSKYRIVGYTNNYIVLSSYDSNTTQDELTIININNNQISIIKNVNYYTLLDNYLVIAKSETFQYAKIDDLIFTDFTTYEDASVFLVTKNNKQYFKIIKSINYFDTNNSLNYYNELEYYDIEAKKLYTVLSDEDKKHITFINDEYFITREWKIFEFYRDDYSRSCIKHRKLTETILDVNNKIYQIDFNNNLEISIKYEFENEDAKYTIYKKTKNSIIFKEETIKKGTSLTEGGYRYDYYELNLDNFKLTKSNSYINTNRETEDSDESLGEITHNNLSYYVKMKRYGGLLSQNTAYYLYSYDEEKQVETLLQFFIKDGGINVEFGRASLYFGLTYKLRRFNNENFAIYNK